MRINNSKIFMATFIPVSNCGNELNATPKSSSSCTEREFELSCVMKIKNQEQKLLTIKLIINALIFSIQFLLIYLHATLLLIAEILLKLVLKTNQSINLLKHFINLILKWWLNRVTTVSDQREMSSWFSDWWSPLLLSLIEESQLWTYDVQTKVGIPLIGSTPTHFCACPKPEPGFPTSYVMVFFVLSDWRW